MIYFRDRTLLAMDNDQLIDYSVFETTLKFFHTTARDDEITAFVVLCLTTVIEHLANKYYKNKKNCTYCEQEITFFSFIVSNVK